MSLSEAATIAGVIQSPSRLSPFNNPERGEERRNVVLQAMADSGFISADAADAPRMSRCSWRRARSTPKRRTSSTTSARSCRTNTRTATGAVDVYTTLDLHMQRLAQDAVRDGLARVDELLAKRKRQRAQAALIAVDPRTGEILALVGGRTYNQSQFNRVIAANRQPGRCSSRSSTSPRSSTPSPKDAPT